MATTSVRVAYRPARVGFLLRAGSIDDVRKAAQIASVLWGGVCHPMLPVVSPDEGAALVERFRPDVLHPIAEDEALTEVIQRFAHLAWPMELEYFEGFTPHNGELPFLDVRPSMAATYNELRHHPASPWTLPTGDDDDLAPLRAVLYGEYADATFADWFTRTLRGGPLPADQLPPGIDWERTPLGVTAFGLEPAPPPGGIRSDGVVIANPFDANDLALYWNLRSLGVAAALWPRENDVLRLRETARGHIERLAREPGPVDVGIHLWATTEWPRDAVLPDDLADALGERRRVLAHLDWHTFSQPLTTPYPAAAEEVSLLGTIEPYESGRARLTLPMPRSPFDGAESEFFQERLLIRTSLLVDRDDTHTLRLPYLPDLNDWYDRELTIVGDGARVEQNAVAIFASAADTSLSLRLARRDDVVRRVLSRAGVAATPSSAGRAVDVVAEQLGGLHGTRVLRAPGVRELLRTPKWRNWKTALAEIERGGLPDQRNQSAGDVLEGLLERRALVGALKLRCPSCGVRERYALDSIAEDMRCPRCRTVFSPAPLLHTSEWEYAASGFFADPGAHGAVPVLLTMMRLTQDSMHDRFVVSSHDLRGDGIECETDLLVLELNRDGRFAVAVAECKDAGTIDERDLENLSAVAERLYASGVECYLIFTTLRNEFAPEELERFRRYRASLDGKWSHDTADHESWPRPAPILLTPRELGQWQFYPANDRADIPQHYNLGLREMAANSAARYLA